METKQVVIISATVIIVAAIVMGGIAYHTRQFVQSGYCEGSIPGMSGFAWVKCGATR